VRYRAVNRRSQHEKAAARARAAFRQVVPVRASALRRASNLPKPSTSSAQFNAYTLIRHQSNHVPAILQRHNSATYIKFGN
jgi:hypothetical protein